MIYFITAREFDFVKIGFSDNPHHRFMQLQVGSPTALALERVTAGGLSEEARLHKQFAADRIRGEWFRLSDALEAFMETLAAPSIAKRASDRNFTITGDGFNLTPSTPARIALRALLEHEGVSQAAFAERIGANRSNFHHILSGRIRPTLDLAAAIEDATGGVIVMRHWVSATPQAEAA